MRTVHSATLFLLFSFAAGPEARASEVVGFSLYDAETDSRISEIESLGEYAVAGRNLAIVAYASGVPGSVAISVESLSGSFESGRTERLAPFSAFGDYNGDLNGHVLEEGSYRVSAAIDGHIVSRDFSLTSPDSASPGGLPTASSRFDAAADFLSLHYDFAPDPDDVLSAVFDRAVVEGEGLDLSRILMVTGAVGTNRLLYQPAQAAAMSTIWPDVSKLDARNNFDNAVVAAADRWLKSLWNGGDVWVKEGGQSDFSAVVVKRVQQLDPSIDTRSRIHIIQHGLWNETYTSADDLLFVRSQTDYIKIADGNYPGNGTAHLHLDYSPTWWNRASASNYERAIDFARTFLSKIDGSDTVELLYILEIGINQVSNPDDLLSQYLESGSSGSSQPPTDGEPNCDSCIFGAMLVDASEDRPIAALSQGAEYDLAGSHLSVQVEAQDAASVTISLSGPISVTRTERAAPYAVFGDDTGDFHGYDLPSGRYSLQATAYDAAGSILDTLALEFTLF